MAGSYNGVAVPSDGNKIGYSGGKYEVPDHPIIPFIEGDGTGRDIWKASLRVFNAAVEKAYKGKRAVAWYEVFAQLAGGHHLAGRPAQDAAHPGQALVIGRGAGDGPNGVL